MPYVPANTPQLSQSSIFAAISRVVGAAVSGPINRLSTARSKRQEYCRAFNELTACSDRVLHDLGIYRCDIPRLVREATYGKHSR